MAGINTTPGDSQNETLVGSIAVDGVPVFDEGFRLVSFALGEVGLSSVEVVLTRGDKSYTLGIETQDAYMERSAINQDAEPTPQGGETVVVGGIEILPRDLMRLKVAPIDTLLPYLVEQV